MYKNDLNEIDKIINKTNVKVVSVCADYFMTHPLHSLNNDESEKSFKVMSKLIKISKKIGIKDIVLPCVDNSSFSSQLEVDNFISVVLKLIEQLEKNDINLAIESDLRPDKLIELVETFDSNKVTVNFDMGNSAGLGYKCDDEFKNYGYRISEVHIKDRVLGGNSVVLGQGNVDFESVLKGLMLINYKGPYIMQAYRDDDGLDIFKKQLYWIKEFLNKV